jgi:hypothetical protein
MMMRKQQMRFLQQLFRLLVDDKCIKHHRHFGEGCGMIDDD